MPKTYWDSPERREYVASINYKPTDERLEELRVKGYCFARSHEPRAIRIPKRWACAVDAEYAAYLEGFLDGWRFSRIMGLCPN